jgi:hypothetical protein
VPDFKPGYYVLAKWDAAHIGTDQEISPKDSMINLYPNPASHQVNITSIPDRGVEVVLLGMDGKTIRKEKINPKASQHSMTIKECQPGSYLIQILDSDSKPLAASRLTVVSP